MFETARRSLSTSRAALDSRRQVGFGRDVEAGQLLGDARGQLLDQGGQHHGAPHELGAAPHEVEGLSGHALQAVDAVHDEARAIATSVGGKPVLEQGLGVATDDGHGSAEVVGQHSRHGSERRHALRGDELLLVEVVLEGEGGVVGDRRSRGAPPPGGRGASAGDAGAPSTSMPTSPLRAISGTSEPSPCALGLHHLPVRHEVARLGRADAAVPEPPGEMPPSPEGRGRRRSRACGPRAGGSPRPRSDGRGQGLGEKAREVLGIGRVQRLVGQAPQRQSVRAQFHLVLTAGKTPLMIRIIAP